MSIVLFILGLFFGSFFLVIISRFEHLQSVIAGRSLCEFCRRTLAWYDLIPLFSFLSLGGKCRYCQKRISVVYPLFELLTGVVFACAFLFLPHRNVFEAFFYLFVSSVLLLVCFIDLRYQLIPFLFVIPAIIIVYVYIITMTPSLLPGSFLSAVAASAFFFLLFVVTRSKGMGFGDVVFAFFMGSLLGFPRIVIGLYLAFILGAIGGIIFVIMKKKKLHGTAIPFGPFLVLGTYGALLIPPSFVMFFWDMVTR